MQLRIGPDGKWCVHAPLWRRKNGECGQDREGKRINNDFSQRAHSPQAIYLSFSQRFLSDFFLLKICEIMNAALQWPVTTSLLQRTLLTDAHVLFYAYFLYPWYGKLRGRAKRASFYSRQAQGSLSWMMRGTQKRHQKTPFPRKNDALSCIFS